jgi:hypothetical protein
VNSRLILSLCSVFAGLLQVCVTFQAEKAKCDAAFLGPGKGQSGFASHPSPLAANMIHGDQSTGSQKKYEKYCDPFFYQTVFTSLLQ